MSSNINPHAEFIETLCGVKITPEKDLLIKIKIPKKKESSVATQQPVVIQKPVYDEKTVFDDPEIIAKIREYFAIQDITKLSNTYDALNNWTIEKELANILGIPDYLYDQFKMLPYSIKCKSITPLMTILKEVMVQKIVNSFKSKETTAYEDIAWEEYIKNEH